ncbi:MAG: hypothetical protein AAF714_05970 [Pseudomonadota bacterium]
MKILATALVLTLTAASASALTMTPFFPDLSFPETGAETSTQSPTLPLVTLPEDK